MNERLLQFIWQFQYFNKSELTTRAGEILQVITPGLYNSNQGPDFLDAKIRLENTVWAGSVELHLKTSEWIKHRHQEDINYKNVILHVVWEHDSEVNEIPLLELKNRIPGLLLYRYEEWMQSAAFIPCGNDIHTIPGIIWKSWNDRLLAERLTRKAKNVEEFLQQNNFHWEETFWWMLARNFGMKVNADVFEMVARSLPLPVLAKHKNQVLQLEALLLGQAGMLEKKFTEDYPVMLQKEYRFLQLKYDLIKVYIQPLFLRMRPINFPTVRLAQLAMIVHQSAHLFSKIRDTVLLKDVQAWFNAHANDYWHYHYRFEECSSFKPKTIGPTMADSILINTIIPVLFAWGEYHREEKYKNRALSWLEEMPAESNHIIQGFGSLGCKPKSAFDSQALIELKNEYCDKKRCLECMIGNHLLKKI